MEYGVRFFRAANTVSGLITMTTARLLQFLRLQPSAFYILTGTLLVLLIGIPDYLIGHGIGFSIFYLIPILISAWYGGRGVGAYIALISAVIWLAADEFSVNVPVGPYVPIWNAIVRLGFFLIVVFLLGAFKREKASAREDYLTGLGNRRNFIELTDAEIKRSQRYGHSFTVAYIDIDNFKAINDRFGHDEGDNLLRAVARVIKDNIRATDIHARLGGDEFALLLPETGEAAAKRSFGKLHKLLSEAGVQTRMTITFSIGVVTFLEPPLSVDAMIKEVDTLMYSAKASGKNLVKYQIVGTERRKLSA